MLASYTLLFRALPQNLQKVTWTKHQSPPYHAQQTVEVVGSTSTAQSLLENISQPSGILTSP